MAAPSLIRRHDEYRHPYPFFAPPQPTNLNLLAGKGNFVAMTQGICDIFQKVH
jgi:hypothetical protein